MVAAATPRIEQDPSPDPPNCMVYVPVVDVTSLADAFGAMGLTVDIGSAAGIVPILKDSTLTPLLIRDMGVRLIRQAQIVDRLLADSQGTYVHTAGMGLVLAGTIEQVSARVLQLGIGLDEVEVSAFGEPA